ncbi:MAG: histidine-type phosphatase [Janthinobacterium lividum]
MASGPAPEERANGPVRHGALPSYLLEKAVIVLRHGVRAPLCSEEIARWSGKPWPRWEVADGQMTPHGRSAVVLMGRYMGEYLTRHGLLADQRVPSGTSLFVSSSHLPRAQESARAFTQGMLPEQPFTLYRERHDRVFLPAEKDGMEDAAPRIRAESLAVHGGALEAARRHHQGDLDTLEAVVGRPAHAAQGVPLSHARLAGLPWIFGDAPPYDQIQPLAIANQMIETFRMQYANAAPLSRVAFGHVKDLPELNALSRLQTAHYAATLGTAYLATHRGSQMMHEIACALKSVESRDTGPQAASIQVYGGHDTNIGALRSMLGFHWHLPDGLPDEMPPGGALVFERWFGTQGEDKGRRFIRVSYVAPSLNQIRDLTPLTLRHPPATQDLIVATSRHVQGIGYLAARDALLEKMMHAIDAGPLRQLDLEPS